MENSNYKVDVYYLRHKKLVKEANTACFAGLKAHLQDVVYVKNFRKEETEKYIPKLLSIINKITECKIVEIEKEEYIFFKMLDTYDRSLILLNFIRNLWWKPPLFDYVKFFEHLTSSTYKDPLKRLCAANVKGCPEKILKNHSNCCDKGLLKIKSVEQLMAFKSNANDLNATKQFLTEA